MTGGCRDCPRCTESVLAQLFWLPWRFAAAILTGWNVGLFRRTCPSCGHRLRIHQRIGGRFAD